MFCPESSDAEICRSHNFPACLLLYPNASYKARCDERFLLLRTWQTQCNASASKHSHAPAVRIQFELTQSPHPIPRRTYGAWPKSKAQLLRGSPRQYSNTHKPDQTTSECTLTRLLPHPGQRLCKHPANRHQQGVRPKANEVLVRDDEPATGIQQLLLLNEGCESSLE